VDGWKRFERSSEISFYAQVNSERSIFVMAGLVPAFHVFGVEAKKDVDARHKAGHDELTRRQLH
jgi:hypothetical protein